MDINAHEARKIVIYTRTHVHVHMFVSVCVDVYACVDVGKYFICVRVLMHLFISNWRCFLWVSSERWIKGSWEWRRIAFWVKQLEAIWYILGVYKKSQRFFTEISHWKHSWKTVFSSEIFAQKSSGRALSPWLVNSASLICDMNRGPSGRVSVSAYCGCWFDLHWWRSQ